MPEMAQARPGVGRGTNPRKESIYVSDASDGYLDIRMQSIWWRVVREGQLLIQTGSGPKSS